MKNPVFLTLWLMAVASFAALAGHHEADKEQVVIGMGLSMDGDSKPLYAGSASLMTIWQEWIDAHNDRDFDKIAAMNGDTFKVMLPNGQRIVGSDEHRALLEGWIDEANTTWEIWWMIPNKVENADGEMEEWLSSGNMLTMTDAEGTVSREFHQVDMQFVDGKLTSGYVSSMENIPAP